MNTALFAPLIGVPLILLFHRKWAKYLAFGFSLLPFIVGIILHTLYSLSPDPSVFYEKEFVFFSESTWFTLENFDIKFVLGVDGISAYLILLAALIFPLLVIYSWAKTDKQEKLYYLMLLILEAGVIGFFLSLDLLLFYVFFEMVLIPTSFFIGIWGGSKREAASIKFFIYTLAGSLVMLLGIIYLGINVSEGSLSTDYFMIRDSLASATNPAFSMEVQPWLFAAFAIGFAIKVPLFPLHTWQALTYSESSTTGSVILAALLSKMGAYGFIRFCLPFFPEVSLAVAPFFMTLAVISVVYGSYLAIVQTNIKKLIAYSSFSHLGFIILGVFSFTQEAMSGAVINMVAHGVSTAALFLLVDMLYERHKTHEIDGFQGVAKIAPKFTILFMITVMTALGLPGLSGFVGEFMILIGSYHSTEVSGVFAIIAALGVIAAAIYLLNSFRVMMFGGINEKLKDKIYDLKPREVAVVMPLVALMIFMGLYATPFLDQINKGADRVLKIVESRVEGKSFTDNTIDKEDETVKILKGEDMDVFQSTK
ncbi:MAG: NADH-quinone oxidoreductase subunit M [Bacteroidota bacterium]